MTDDCRASQGKCLCICAVCSGKHWNNDSSERHYQRLQRSGLLILSNHPGNILHIHYLIWHHRRLLSSSQQILCGSGMPLPSQTTTGLVRPVPGFADLKKIELFSFTNASLLYFLSRCTCRSTMDTSEVWLHFALALCSCRMKAP